MRPPPPISVAVLHRESSLPPEPCAVGKLLSSSRGLHSAIAFTRDSRRTAECSRMPPHPLRGHFVVVLVVAAIATTSSASSRKVFPNQSPPVWLPLTPRRWQFCSFCGGRISNDFQIPQRTLYVPAKVYMWAWKVYQYLCACTCI